MENNIAFVTKARVLHRELVCQGFTRQQAALFLLQILVLRACESAGLFLGSPLTYALSEASDSEGDIDLAEITCLLNENLSAFPSQLSRPLPCALPASALSCTLDFMSSISWNAQLASQAATLYEATLSCEDRSANGIFYTGTELIHRCIDDLFLKNLRSESERIKSVFSAYDFLDHMHSLSFLDTSSGCGSFLFEIYRSLHEIELTLCKRINIAYRPVALENFSGIEIDPSAVWLSKIFLAIQCRSCEIEACRELMQQLSLFELELSSGIICADALSTCWKPDIDYIVGNPPYVTHMSEEQSAASELLSAKRNDYCSCWLIKTFEYLRNNRHSRAAYLLTSSVCQGSSISLWSRHRDISINFAWQPFDWTSDSPGSADLSCVVIGLSHVDTEDPVKVLHCASGVTISCEHINCCLQQLPDPPALLGTIPNDRPVMVRSHRSRSVCPTGTGNVRYITAANLLEDIQEHTSDYAASEIHKATSDQPTIIIPRHSSASRKIIPMIYADDLEFVTNESVLVIDDASMYLFALLSSAVHQDYVKALCGRLDTSYRYSSALYYNFPIIYSSDGQRLAEINKLGKAIIASRTRMLAEGNTSLGKLYSADCMPPELLRLHMKLDLMFDEIYFGKLVFRSLDRLKLLYELIENSRNDQAQ